MSPFWWFCVEIANVYIAEFDFVIFVQEKEAILSLYNDLNEYYKNALLI